MYRLIVVLLLCVSFGLSAAEVPAHTGAADVVANANGEPNQTVSMIGGGLLGMVVASGMLGMLFATTMMFEGTGITEAVETGANLPMPIAVLSAILGGVFAQDFVQRNIKYLSTEWNKTSAH